MRERLKAEEAPKTGPVVSVDDSHDGRVREITLGGSRGNLLTQKLVEEFRSLSGAARSTLTSRLAGLVDHGLLDRVPYSETPPRFEYRLTEQGLALYGVTLVIWRWEHLWAPSGAGIGIPRPLRVSGLHGAAAADVPVRLQDQDGGRARVSRPGGPERHRP